MLTCHVHMPLSHNHKVLDKCFMHMCKNCAVTERRHTVIKEKTIRYAFFNINFQS